MRKRLLISTLLLVVATLLLFAIPLALATQRAQIDGALDALAGEARQIATFLDDASNCAQVELRLAALDAQVPADTSIAVLTADGSAGVAVGDQDVVPGPELAAAMGSGQATAHRAGQLAAAVQLQGRACRVPLVAHLTRADDAVRADVRRSWVLIAVLGAGALAVAGAAAALLGRRLADPFEQLALAAQRLGDGDFSGHELASALPEADAIGRALAATADRLGRALDRGTAFATDTSHQLRTPLTALRLHLEALESHGADPVAIAGALAEADRLTATLDELQQLTRLDAPAEPTDLGVVVQQRLDAWEHRARDAGREVRFERAPVPLVRARGAAIGQAVAVLLDNALEHGVGTVTVRVRPDVGADGQTRAVRIDVIDEGLGPPPAVAHLTEAVGRADRRGSGAAAGAEPGRDTGSSGAGAGPGRGRGLRLARALVEAEGGRLSLGSTVDGTCAGIVVALGDGDATHA